jgi:Uma2 family endonuclease
MAERAVQPQPMTFEEAARIDRDEFPGEVVDGEWIPVTRSTYRHGEILLSIGSVLKQYTRANPDWTVVGGDAGAKLRRSPDTLRGADVAVVRRDRFPTGKGVAGWLEGSPDLAIEIAGDSQSMSSLLKKAMEYLRAGSQMVWLLEEDPRHVVVLTSPDHIRVLGEEETLDGGDLLPGFSCTVRELFE